MTTDNKNLFAAIADTNFINKFPGKPTPGIYSLNREIELEIYSSR